MVCLEHWRYGGRPRGRRRWIHAPASGQAGRPADSECRADCRLTIGSSRSGGSGNPGASSDQGRCARRRAGDFSPHRTMLTRYCFSCHNQQLKTAGLALDTLDLTTSRRTPTSGKRSSGSCAAASCRRSTGRGPIARAMDAFASWLEGELDRAAARESEPGPGSGSPAESRRVHQRRPRPARRRHRARRCCRPTKSATASTTSRAT